MIFWINDLDSYDFLRYSHGIFLLLCSKKDHWAPIITGHRHIEMTKGQSPSTRPDLQMEEMTPPMALLSDLACIQSVNIFMSFSYCLGCLQLVKAH